MPDFLRLKFARPGPNHNLNKQIIKAQRRVSRGSGSVVEPALIMAEATKRGEENMRPIEELLERLYDDGHLELPERSSEEGTGYALIKPSETARAVGKRVRQRVLSRLGLTDVGPFIARERKAREIKPQEISRKIKLSREVLREIETSRLPFFELSSRKAADLIEVLNLDPEVVLLLLRSTDLSQLSEQQPAPLFRTDRGLDEGQRMELEKQSLEASKDNRDRQKRFEEFVQDFVAELSRRGILKR